MNDALEGTERRRRNVDFTDFSKKYRTVQDTTRMVVLVRDKTEDRKSREKWTEIRGQNRLLVWKGREKER